MAEMSFHIQGLKQLYDFLHPPAYIAKQERTENLLVEKNSLIWKNI